MRTIRPRRCPAIWQAADPSEADRRDGFGLITGASDDDPTGIATYSQASAQFGYEMS